jgi:hypothetical protein
MIDTSAEQPFYELPESLVEEMLDKFVSKTVQRKKCNEAKIE